MFSYSELWDVSRLCFQAFSTKSENLKTKWGFPISKKLDFFLEQEGKNILKLRYCKI